MFEVMTDTVMELCFILRQGHVGQIFGYRGGLQVILDALMVFEEMGYIGLCGEQAQGDWPPYELAFQLGVGKIGDEC